MVIERGGLSCKINMDVGVSARVLKSAHFVDPLEYDVRLVLFWNLFWRLSMFYGEVKSRWPDVLQFY